VSGGIGIPKVLPVGETRELYTRLSQAQCKVEEALRVFRDRCILIWAPDANDQTAKIISALQHLLSSEGIKVRVQFLIPYVPLPGCHTPELILDLWSHPLLQQKFKNCVSGMSFISEASRCVFTRDNNPVHVNRNVAAITVQADAPPNNPSVLSMRSLLLDVPSPGETLIIDGPAESILTIWHMVNAGLVGDEAQYVTGWKLHRRSQACSAAHPRSEIVGQTNTRSLLIIVAIVGAIKTILNNRRDCLIGHSMMFANNANIVLDGTMLQILALQDHMRECVAISPTKVLFLSKSSAEDFSTAITGEESLRTVVTRYRKSGPLSGAPFAKPKALASHVAAQRCNSWIAKQPFERAALLRQQVILEVLNLDGSYYSEIPAALMYRVQQAIGVEQVEVTDQFCELAAQQWRSVLRDDKWSGKIKMQCNSQEQVKHVYDKVHGTRICLNGLFRTIDVSSPTDVLLSAGPPPSPNVQAGGGQH
jgi:hypothetical protein